MTFSTLICSCWVALASVALAQEVDPQELKDLRTAYERAKKGALDPLEQKYVNALKTLKDQMIQQKRQTEAIAVEVELSNFQPPATLLTSSPQTAKVKKSGELDTSVLGDPMEVEKTRDFLGKEPSVKVLFYPLASGVFVTFAEALKLAQEAHPNAKVTLIGPQHFKDETLYELQAMLDRNPVMRRLGNEREPSMIPVDCLFDKRSMTVVQSESFANYGEYKAARDAFETAIQNGKKPEKSDHKLGTVYNLNGGKNDGKDVWVKTGSPAVGDCRISYGAGHHKSVYWPYTATGLEATYSGIVCVVEAP